MILCAGEALIDMLARKTAQGHDAFEPFPGGAVFNTAVALGRLGAEAAFFSGLSDDLFGQRLQRALEASRVDATLAVISKRPTTLAFVQLADGQATYTFYDENTAGRMLGESDLPELPARVSALFFGGISLAVMPCAEAYEALMMRETGRLTMLDPNIRPDFISDVPAYRARIARMMARADIVKLSDEDLLWLSGSGDPVALARELIGDSARIVFLTEGADGARAITRTLELHAPAPRVEVVDTVGAGDTFNAGVLAALDRAGALDKAALGTIDAATLSGALSLGVRAAAVTVSRAGANPPWKDEL